MRSGYRFKVGPFWVSGTFKSTARQPSARSNRYATYTLIVIFTLLAMVWVTM
jgi:hypothetical protein